jgi:hypothetical protein
VKNKKLFPDSFAPHLFFSGLLESEKKTKFPKGKKKKGRQLKEI